VPGSWNTPFAKKIGIKAEYKVALPLGCVDIKVCAVTEVWSGLKLVVRKKLRQISRRT
jgi:hypothetical protein